MASDKESAIERARQHAAAGQFDLAIEAWRQLLDKSTNDANVYDTIGDLYLKAKSNTEAVEAYNRAAQLFLQQGLHPKVIAVYKKVLKCQPGSALLRERIGDLYAAQGLKNEAIADYLAGAKLHLKADKRGKALSLFRKITEVDPQNTSVRMRVAELCLKENRTDEAIDEYLLIGREYQRLQKDKEARDIYEQVLKLSPNHAEARRRLETPYQPERDIPEVVPPALEITLPEEVQVGGVRPELKTPTPASAPDTASPPLEVMVPEEGPSGDARAEEMAGTIEFNLEELETPTVPAAPDTPSPPLEVMVPEKGQAGDAQAGETGATIEFNPEELETLTVPAAAVGGAAATPAEALRLLEAGDIAQAERVVRTLLLDDPEGNECQAMLGLVYLQKGDASTAYEILYPVVKAWVEEGRQ